MPSRMLLAMPLHAITEVYGEPGLRDRFALELESFDEPERRRLTEALTLAAALHADDRRSREPYLNHLLRVTIRIIRYYDIRDVDVLVAALLHDAVEDHPGELAGFPDGRSAAPVEAALDVLADRFNPRVAGLVRSVTNSEFDPARDRNEQYRHHVTTSLESDPWARVIKISDFTDNGVGIIHSAAGDKVRSSAEKYRPLVDTFRDLIGRPDTPLSAAAKSHIFGQLDLAEQRFAAILDT